MNSSEYSVVLLPVSRQGARPTAVALARRRAIAGLPVIELLGLMAFGLLALQL
jgi:hypothetical protein